MKQWDKKHKEAQHLKKEYADTVVKLKALKTKRTQTQLDLSGIQTQWDELDTNLVPATAESGQESVETTYMALDSDTERDHRKSKRKLNPGAPRIVSRMFIPRTPSAEATSRPSGASHARRPHGSDVTDLLS